MDTVTAIVTTHKRPLLLRRALMSILSQVAEGLRIELIVSDDDAEASGLQALTSIIEIVGSISLRYVKRPADAFGVAASRNRALAQATGEWVLLLDDDDALRPNVISPLLRCAKESNAQACIGNYRRCKESANGRVTEIREIQVPDGTLCERLPVSNFIPIGSFIIQRSQIRSHFNANLKTHEDCLFLLDNLAGAHVAVLKMDIVDVYISADGARSHRNTESGQKQMAADSARIHSMYPNPAFYQALCKSSALRRVRICRQAKKADLRMGTWPISVVHESVGGFAGHAWRRGYETYLEKGGDCAPWFDEAPPE